MYKKSSSSKSFTGLSLSIFLVVGVVIPAVVLAQIKTNTLNLTVPKTLSLPSATKVITPTTTSSTDTGSSIIKQFELEAEPVLKSAPPTSLLQVSSPSTDKATTATPTEDVSVNKLILPTVNKLTPEVETRAAEPVVKEVQKNSEGEIANQVERVVPVVTKVIEPIKVVEPTERDEVFEPVEVEVRKPGAEVIPVKVSIPEVVVSPVVKPAPKIEPIKPELKAPEVLEIPRVQEPGGVLTTESDVSSDQAEDESSEPKEDENNNENKKSESVQVERVAVPVRRPAVVVTAQDFEVVTASVLERASENVLSAKAESESKVSVEIVRPAKLFGILPVKIKEKVVVEKDSSTGQISTEVRQPWWSRLASGRKNTAEKAGAVASNNSVGQSWSLAADLVSDLVRALDSENNNSQSSDTVPVIRLAYARETGIPVASSEDLLIVDLEEKIVEEFIGSSPLARNRIQKENFVRVALSGTFRGLTSGQLTAIRSSFNSSALQSEAVAGTERVLDYLSDNGLTSQYRAFLRSVTPLFLASTRGGDAAADFLVRRRSEITSIFGVGATIPLLTGVSGGSTMVVFHNCFSGAGLSGTCADMSKIISAISDPRSLFNTCHLGNMVADGPKASPNGGSYYGCLPTAQFCAGLGQNESADKLGNIASSGAAGGLSGNVGTSPDLANVNTKQNALTSSQGQEVCTSGVLGRAGQNLAALESCMDNAISAIRAADRASTSGIAGCVGELLGISTPAGSEPTIGQQADAYLNGQGCGGLSDGADADGAADSNPPATDNKDKEDKDTENKNSGDNTKQSNPVPVVVENKSIFGGISNFFSKLFGGGEKNVVDVSGGGVDLTKIREVDVDGNEVLELKSPAPISDAISKLMLDIGSLQQIHESGVANNSQEIEAKVSQLRGLLNQLEKNKNKNQECSGEDCVCNEAMARTLQAITSCTDAALTQAALASGRGPESVPTGGSREPIGPYTNPNPETAGVGNADQSNPAFQCTLAILSGGSNAGGVWSSGGACGLMMCADGTTNCCHRQVGVSPALLQMLKSSRDCAELRCAPDAPCECAGELPEQGGVGPSAPTGPVDLEFDAPNIDIEEEFTVEPSGRSSGSLVPNRGIDRP